MVLLAGNMLRMTVLHDDWENSADAIGAAQARAAQAGAEGGAGGASWFARNGPPVIVLHDGLSGAQASPPPPPSRTKWTRLVHPSVLIGHVSSH